MKKTRVGIVGMGMIGRAHLDALRRLPSVEVVAICGLDPDETASQAEAYAIPGWYTDYRDLLERVDLDAVHNCTPNASHDAINRAVIGKGMHIYAEKPLSNTARDAYAIWQYAEDAGVVHGLNHQYRMNPAVQEMRQRVRGGDVGRIFLVSGRYHQQSGLYETDYGWRMTEGGLSCGLSDIGTHWVDTARCVVGRRIERVFATVQTIHPVRTKQDGTRIDVCTDDLSCVLMQFEGGAQGVLTVSKVSAGHMNDLVLGVDGQHYSMHWAQENPTHLHLGYKNAPNADIQAAPALTISEAADLVSLPGGHPLGWNDALLASIREFYRAVRGEISHAAMRCATFQDGFAGMAFVEAALESHRTGRWAEVAQENEYGKM